MSEGVLKLSVDSVGTESKRSTQITSGAKGPYFRELCGRPEGRPFQSTVKQLIRFSVRAKVLRAKSEKLKATS